MTLKKIFLLGLSVMLVCLSCPAPTRVNDTSRRVHLAWDYPSSVFPSHDRFIIFWNRKGKPLTRMVTLPADYRTAVVFGLTPGFTYQFYAVSAYGETRVSAPSNTVRYYVPVP